MEIKKATYDTRGRQRNVLRLAAFDREGLAHIITYRLLAVLSIITGAFIFMDIYFGGGPLSLITRALILIVWLLFGIELYSTYKAFAIIVTKGVAFGRLDKSFLDSQVKAGRAYSFFEPAGFVMLAAWYLLFVVFAWVMFV